MLGFIKNLEMAAISGIIIALLFGIIPLLIGTLNTIIISFIVGFIGYYLIIMFNKTIKK